MNAHELKQQYEDALRERLNELQAEIEIVQNLLAVSAPTADDAGEPKPGRRRWTRAQREAQSRRLKAFHKNRQ